MSVVAASSSRPCGEQMGVVEAVAESAHARIACLAVADPRHEDFLGMVHDEMRQACLVVQ